MPARIFVLHRAKRNPPTANAKCYRLPKLRNEAFIRQHPAVPQAERRRQMWARHTQSLSAEKKANKEGLYPSWIFAKTATPSGRLADTPKKSLSAKTLHKSRH